MIMSRSNGDRLLKDVLVLTCLSLDPIIRIIINLYYYCYCLYYFHFIIIVVFIVIIIFVLSYCLFCI